MSERCKYVAIDGTELEFRKNGNLFLGMSDLRRFAYTPYIIGNKIESFERVKNPVNSIPIYITIPDADMRNRIFEVFEKDIIYKNEHPKSNEAGKLYIGDYYITGFVYESEPGNYLTQTKTLRKHLSFIRTSKVWIKEQNFTFSDSYEEDDVNGLDYPHDFQFDYGVSARGNSFTINALSASKFRIRISGPICSPEISIGENRYGADVVVEENELLTIDSRYNAVYITKANGETENCFNERFRTGKEFEPIPAGVNKLIYDKRIKFDITIFIERSEPEWI